MEEPRLLRIDAHGQPIYANPASGAVLRFPGVSVGALAETIARFDARSRKWRRH
jgi:hypothetical protein